MSFLWTPPWKEWHFWRVISVLQARIFQKFNYVRKIAIHALYNDWFINFEGTNIFLLTSPWERSCRGWLRVYKYAYEVEWLFKSKQCVLNDRFSRKNSNRAILLKTDEKPVYPLFSKHQRTPEKGSFPGYCTAIVKQSIKSRGPANYASDRSLDDFSL